MGSTSTKVKKNETKTAFKQWNTDGDKFLTFKEFDAGMQSLGITQEGFLFSFVILECPYLLSACICSIYYAAIANQ